MKYNNTAIKIKGPKHALKVQKFYEQISDVKFYEFASFNKGDFIGVWKGEKKHLFTAKSLDYLIYKDVLEIELPDSNNKPKHKELVAAYEDGYNDALNCIMEKCVSLKEGLKNRGDE